MDQMYKPTPFTGAVPPKKGQNTQPFRENFQKRWNTYKSQPHGTHKAMNILANVGSIGYQITKKNRKARKTRRLSRRYRR